MTDKMDLSLKLGHRPSLPEEMAAIIVRQIEEGDYSPGDMLPAELTLAKTFNVSRTVVREALARLKFEGIIKSKRGKGPIVCDPSNKRIFSLPTTFVSDTDKAQFLEFRIIIERESTALAAERRTEKHLAKMRQNLEDMEQAIDNKKSGLVPDYKFHCMIAEAAGNEYVNSFMQFLSSKLIKGVQDARWLSNQDFHRARVVLEEHRAIFEAIRNQEPVSARKAIYTHLFNSADRQGLPLTGFLSTGKVD